MCILCVCLYVCMYVYEESDPISMHSFMSVCDENGAMCSEFFDISAKVLPYTKSLTELPIC